jgi:hypothetical protein
MSDHEDEVVAAKPRRRLRKVADLEVRSPPPRRSVSIRSQRVRGGGKLPVGRWARSMVRWLLDATPQCSASHDQLDPRASVGTRDTTPTRSSRSHAGGFGVSSVGGVVVCSPPNHTHRAAYTHFPPLASP